MNSIMEKDQLEKMAEELAKGIKVEEDLSDAFNQLMKKTLEKALEAEMDDHLGYDKHEKSEKRKQNHRNGHSKKRLKTGTGEFDLETPRDRDASYEPKIVKKRQRRFTGLDEKILTLYAKGQTTRDIAETLKDLYDVDVSHTLISQVTDAVIDEVRAWQQRPLEALYPIVYLDCIVVKVHQDKRVVRKAIYVALGINTLGMKELLGLWISENEGAKFWMSVLTELQQRGVQDIIIACVDGLTGFPDAISTVFPKTTIQLCMVHMVRNSLKYVSYKDRKAVASDLKRIYASINAEDAEQELMAFAEKWDGKYGSISKQWYRNWENIITMFNYPDEIRKVIYTTNAIESLNSVIRKSIKNRRIFPNDTSALKIVYLAVQQASRRWTMPIRDWGPAMNRFLLEYEERIVD